MIRAPLCEINWLTCAKSTSRFLGNIFNKIYKQFLYMILNYKLQCAPGDLDRINKYNFVVTYVYIPKSKYSSHKW